MTYISVGRAIRRCGPGYSAAKYGEHPVRPAAGDSGDFTITITTTRPADSRRIDIDEGTLAYTIAGTGAPLLLVHGLGGDRRTWDQIVDVLAADFTVIAPDLPGHGASDAPSGDYSLGAHASALRDLLVALGHRAATIVGHSLGGGIAMQFAYQFPDRVDRLILISSGGLGPHVTPMLRAATLPGADTVVAGLARLPEAFTRPVLGAAAKLPGLLAPPDAGPLARSLHQFTRPGPRHAFIRTARTVIDWRGQTVSALRHLKQLADLPILLAWGSADKTIPPAHHRAAVDLLGSPPFIEIVGAGHYPHETSAEQLLPAMQAFLTSTAPFRYSESRWRHLLASGRTATD